MLSEFILNPACDVVSWQNYPKELKTLLFELANTHREKTCGSLLGLGVQLYYEGHFKESEECWKKILEFSENDNAALSNLGVVFAEQKRYAEAEEAYRNAIAKDPNSAATYNNLAILLRVTNQAKDALPVLQQLIEINPEDFNPYLGIVSIKKALGESIELSFIEKARLYIPEDDFYNRACLESICDNFDLAFEYLQKAVQKEGFDFTWAWKDPDLQWIRDDPRFIKIVGPKPENENSEI